MSRIVDGSTADEARVQINFHSNGSVIATMYVKESDTDSEIEKILYDPGVGDVGDLLFKGWTFDKEYTIENAEHAYNETDYPTGFMTIEDIRKWAGARENTEGDIVDIYAMLFESYTVKYLDIDGVTLRIDSILKKAEDTQNPTYTVNMQYTVPSAEQHFEGWLVHEGSSNIESAIYEGEQAQTPYQNGTELTIKGNVALSVNAPRGHWLIFDENGTGATYNAPRFYETEETTVKPRPDSDMQRNGYTFGGWYTDKACTEGSEFVFGNTLSDKTTIYAKWVENKTADYTVLIWKQNSKGDGYDFAESVALSGNVGTNINTVSAVGSGDDRYASVNGNAKRYTGFHLSTVKPNENGYDTDVKIKTEGNSVLNVYYDRNIVTLTFQIRGYVYTPDDYGNYGLVNGEYVELHYDWENETWSYGTGEYEEGYVQVYDNSGTQYGIVDGEYVQIHLGSWGRWYDNNNQRYYGNRYRIQQIEKMAVYSGTQYSRTSGWQTIETMTGLYGSTLAANGYTWPSNYDWYDDYQSWGGEYSGDGTRTTFLDAFILSNGGSNQTFYGFSTSGGNTVHFLKRDGNGNYIEANKVTTSGGTFYISDKYNGYKAVSYSTNNTSWTTLGNKDSDGYYASVSNYNNLYIRYDPLLYNLMYYDGVYVDGNNNPVSGYENRGKLKEVSGIPFESEMNSYNKGRTNYYEPEFKGFVFEGWYLDDQCINPCTFTSMATEGITVYAKWRQIQYRVFLHPNADTDPSLDWGSENQEMNFRISYGQKVSIPTGLRDDYELVGWYLDEAFTEPFDAEAYALNEDTVQTDYDKEAPENYTDPMDKWGNGATYNSDLTGFEGKERFWITKKLDLYAQWRSVLHGANGIYVIYDVKPGTGTVTDGTAYVDKADAIAQGAATAPEKQQFLHWVVQSWDGTAYKDTETIVYPGDTFKVLKDNAQVVVSKWVNPKDNDDIKEVEELIPGTTPPDSVHTKILEATYKVQLRAEYGPADAATPTHVWWFANFGENEKNIDNIVVTGYDDEGKPIEEDIGDENPMINQAIRIKSADTFARPGYAFLGWARVDAEIAEGKIQDLTADDLFLKYIGQDKDGNSIYEDTKGNKVTYIAADEKNPYHDMYAVWHSLIIDIEFKKVDEDNTSIGLKDAVFELQDTKGKKIAEATSDAEGNVKFENVIPGENEILIIKEISSPVGYKGSAKVNVANIVPDLKDGKYQTRTYDGKSYVLAKAELTGDINNGLVKNKAAVKLTIKKEWITDYDKAEAVNVKVKIGDKPENTVVLNNNNNWTYTYPNLDKGTVVTVTEESLLPNFSTSYNWKLDTDTGEGTDGAKVEKLELTGNTTITIKNTTKIIQTGVDLNTTAAKTALLSLFAFAMMCVLGFSLKRRYVSRR